MIDPNTHLPVKVHKPATLSGPRVIPQQMNPNTNPGQGYTLSDEYKNYDFNFIPGLDMDEIRAQNQSTGALIAKGTGRLLSGAVMEALKVIPYLGGGAISGIAAMAGQENPMSWMVDNAVLRGLNDAQEFLQEDLMTIYQTHAANGSLTDRMFDGTFWATQGADAGAFFLSMILPGRLAKMAKIGTSLQKGVTAAGKFGKVLKPTFQASAKAGAIMDDIAATMVNTMAESAAEASNFYTNTRDQLMNEGMSEEEAANIAGGNAAGLFAMNMGILGVSNFLFDAMLFKSFNNVLGIGEGARFRPIFDDAGKVINKPTTTQWFKRGAAGLGIGTLSEGFYEEGFQYAAEKYFEERAHALQGKDTGFFKGAGDAIAGTVDQYIQRIASDADMHTGIFLGSVLGGIAGAGGGIKSGIDHRNNIEGYTPNDGAIYSKARRFLGFKPREPHEGLRSLLEKNFVDLTRSVNDIFVYDENGNLVWDEDGVGGRQPKIDEAKFDEFSAKRKLELMHMAKLREFLLNNDQVNYDMNKVFLDFQAMLPYFQTPGGMETLKQHLDAKAQKEIADALEQNPDVTLTPEQLSESLWKDAQEFKKIYDRIQDTHSHNFRVRGEDKQAINRFSNLVNENKLSTALHEYSINKGLRTLKEKLGQFDENTADGAASIEQYEKEIEKLEKEKEKITKEGKRLYNNKEVQKMYDRYVRNRDQTQVYGKYDVLESPDGSMYTVSRRQSDPLGQNVTYYLQDMKDSSKVIAVDGDNIGEYKHYGNTATDMEEKIPIKELTDEEKAEIESKYKALLDEGDAFKIAEFYNENIANTGFRIDKESRAKMHALLEEKIQEMDDPKALKEFADTLFDKTKSPGAAKALGEMVMAKIKSFQALRSQEIAQLKGLIQDKKTNLKEVEQEMDAIDQELKTLRELLINESTNFKVSMRTLKETFKDVDKRSDTNYRAAKENLKTRFETQINIIEARLKDLAAKRDMYDKVSKRLKDEILDTEKFDKWLKGKDALKSMQDYLDDMKKEHHVLVESEKQLESEIRGREVSTEDLFDKRYLTQAYDTYRKLIENIDDAIRGIEEDIKEKYRKQFDETLQRYFEAEESEAADIEKRLEEIKKLEEQADQTIKELKASKDYATFDKIRQSLYDRFNPNTGEKVSSANRTRIGRFEESIQAVSDIISQLDEKSKVRRKQPETRNPEPPLQTDQDKPAWSLKRNYTSLFGGLTGMHYDRDGNINPVQSQQRYFHFNQINDVTKYKVQIVRATDYPELFSQAEKEALAKIEDEEVRNAEILIAVVIDPASGKPVDLFGNTHDTISANKSIYTTLPVPTTNLEHYKERVYRPQGVSPQLHEINIRAQVDYYKELRKHILERIADGNIPTFQIAGKSRGIGIYDTLADGKTINNKRFSDVGIDVFNSEIVIPTSDVSFAGNLAITGLKGQVFVTDQYNNVHRGYIRTMNAEEQETVIQIFKLMAAGKSSEDIVPNTQVTIFDALNTMMYYGAHKDDKTPMSDYTDATGTRYLNVEGQRFALRLMDDGTLYKEDVIRASLQSRYANVRSKIINDASTEGNYYAVTYENGQFVSVPYTSHKTRRDNYLQHLFEPESGTPTVSTYAPQMRTNRATGVVDTTVNQFKTQYLFIDYSDFANQYGLAQPAPRTKAKRGDQAPMSESEEVVQTAIGIVTILKKYNPGNNYAASEDPGKFFDQTEWEESPVVVFRDPDSGRAYSIVKYANKDGGIYYKLHGWDMKTKTLQNINDDVGEPITFTSQAAIDYMNGLNATNRVFIHKTDAPAKAAGPQISQAASDNVAAQLALLGDVPPPPVPGEYSEEGQEPSAPSSTQSDNVAAQLANLDDAPVETTPTPPDNELDSAKEKAKARMNRRNYRSRLPVQNTALEDVPEMVQWFRKKFPNVPITVADRLINNESWGTFSNAGVAIYNMAGTGTTYHEAFHVVFNLYMSPKERRDLIKAYRDHHNLTASAYDIEEMLADDFMNYMLTGSLADVKIYAQKSFFRRLWDLLKSLFGGKTLTDQYKVADLSELFNVIKTQDFNTKPKYSFGSGQRSRVPGLELSEMNDALDVVQWFFFSELMADAEGPSLMQTLLRGEQVVNANQVKTMLGFDSSGDDIITQILTMTDTSLVEDDEFPFPYTPSKDVRNNTYRIFSLIHANRGLFMRAFVDRMDKLGIKITIPETDIWDREEAGLDETEVAGYAQDTQYDVVSIEISGKKNATTTLRKFLSTFSNTSEDGLLAPGPLGLPTNINFGKVYSMMANKLANHDTMDQMVETLQSFNADFRNVYNQMKRRLNEETEESKIAEDWIAKLQFFQAFAKQRINYYLTLVGDDGSYTTFDASQDYATKKLLRTWQENGIRNGAYTTDKEGNRILNPDILLPMIDKFEDTGVAFEKRKQAIQILQLMGIELTSFLDEHGRSVNVNDMTTETSNRIVHLIDLVKRGFNANSETGSRDIYAEGSNNYKNVRHLAELELQVTSDFLENQHFNADGKTVYDVSLNHYMSILINKINRADSIEQLMEDLPFLNDTYLTHSILKDRLFKKGGRVPFRLSIHEGLKSDAGNINRMFRHMNKAEKFFMWFNDTLDGKYHMHRAADNALERVIEVDGELFPNPLQDGAVSDPVLQTMVGYLADEIEVSKYDHWSQFTKNTVVAEGQAPVFLFDFLKDPKYAKAYSQVVSAYQQFKNNSISSTVAQLSTPEIKEAIAEFLNEKINETKEMMTAYKLISPVPGNPNSFYNHSVNAAGFGSQSNLDGSDIHNIAARVTINDIVMSIEQTKWFTGHPAFYKSVAEFYKRMSAMVGTKKLIETSPTTNKFIKENLTRQDGRHLVQEDVPTIRVHVYADIPGQSRNEQISKAYRKEYDESDAQGYITLDEYREFLFRTGDWTPEMEQVYLWETGHRTIPEDTSFAGLTPGAAIDSSKFGTNKYVLPPLKPQYFGPTVTGRPEYIPTMFKLSLLPLTQSLTKGRGLEALAESMKQNQVGIAMVASANKIGTKKDSNGDSPSFYDKDGKINPINPEVIQESRYDFWGIQVDNAPKRKEEGPSGSQQLKQHKSDLYSQGKPRAMSVNKYTYNKTKKEFEISKYKEDEAAEYLDKEFNRLQSARMTIGLQLLRNKFGINPDGSIDSYEQVIKSIIREAKDRDMPQNIIDSLQLMVEGGEFNVETSVAREKIENTLAAMAESMTISRKRRGAGFVQASSAGFETRSRVISEDGIVYSDHDLKFYTNENGVVTSMEVYLPSIFKDRSRNYIDHNELNDMIKEGTIDIRLLEAVGFRIPTQGLSSIEHIRIKGFLPASAGDVVVMPPEIVVKNGSDFDFDKLTTLLSNYVYGRKGLEYIEYTENPADFDRLFEQRREDIIRDYNLEQGELKELFKELNEYTRALEIFSEKEAEGIGHIKTRQDLTLASMGGAIAKLQARIAYIDAEFADFEAIEDTLTDDEHDEYLDRLEADAVTDEHREELVRRMEELSKDLEKYKSLDYVMDLKSAVATEIKKIQERKSKLLVAIAGIKSDINKEARQFFNGLSIYEKNGIKAIENRMNELEKEIILAPSNFELLTAPLDGGEIKSEAYYIKELLGEANEEGELYSSMLSPRKTVDTQDQFLNANAGVGISALQATNHIFAQRHNLFVRQNFIDGKGNKIDTRISGLRHNLNPDGTISLAHRENMDGQNIAMLLSQMTSAYVDAAKDPFVFYLNAGTETANVFMYLMRAGVPLRELVLFMNQPIIKEFLFERSIYESVYYDRAHVGDRSAVRGRDAIAESVARRYGTANPSDMDYSIEAMEENIRNRASLSESQRVQQRGFLSDFLRYMDTARAVSDMINATTYDTRGLGKNINALTHQLRSTIEVHRRDAIGNFKDIFTDTNGFLTPYYQAALKILEYFDHYSITLRHTGLQEDMIYIISSMMAAGKTKTQIVKVLDRFKTEFVTYLLHQSPDINSGRVNELFYGSDSLPNRLIKLKGSMRDSLNPNPFVMALEAIIPPNVMDSHSIRVMSSTRIDKDTADEWSEGWSKLFTTHPHFANDLVDFIIIQSGITNSPLNFIQYIPADVYTQRMNAVTQEGYSYQDFFDKFFRNNVNDNDIVPHNRYNKRHADIAPYKKHRKDSRDDLGKLVRGETRLIGPDGPVDQMSVEEYGGNFPHTMKDYHSRIDVPQNTRSGGDITLSLYQLDRKESNIGIQSGAELPQLETSNPVNIYAGTNENVDLSNFAIRPFVIQGEKFDSVEQYFQLQKFRIAEVMTYNTQEAADKIFEIADKISDTKDGPTLKKLGNTRIEGVTFNKELWDSLAEGIMTTAIKASFEQNPQAAKKLLATGNNKLTHTQDKSKWGTKFPEILMSVRNSLQPDSLNVDLVQQGGEGTAQVIFSDGMYPSTGTTIYNPTATELAEFIGQNPDYAIYIENGMSEERKASVAAIIEQANKNC